MKESNVIWATMKAWLKGDAESDRPGVYEVLQLNIFGQDYISNISPEIKTIIAFYSKLYITEENAELANALGDFSSLTEAQDALLKDKEHFFKNVEKHNFLHGIFEIETEDNLVYAKLSAMIGSYKGTDTFQIHENGDIEYIQPPSPTIATKIKLGEGNILKKLFHKEKEEEIEGIEEIVEIEEELDS